MRLGGAAKVDYLLGLQFSHGHLVSRLSLMGFSYCLTSVPCNRAVDSVNIIIMNINMNMSIITIIIIMFDRA